MAKFLLTGCAGFIGSHLTESLLNAGHEVIGIDNFDPFYAREIKERNLEVAKSQERFRLIEGDLADQSTYDLISETPDIVIHLAAKAGVRPSIEDPQGYIRANIQATNLLLEWMKTTTSRKLIFASSSSVYGNNKKIPFHEADAVNEAISPYAFTKRSCEIMNYSYHSLFDFSILNLRFFTVYGPRQRPDLAIHKFTRLITSGEPIQMYGDGSTSRDYTFIDDIVEGLNAAIRYIDQETSLFEIINIGNNQPMALKDLIHLIYTILEKEPKIDQLPMQPGDVDRTYADISKASALLDYQPQTSMETGLRSFVDWYNAK